VKAAGSRGYFAVAKVQQVITDPSAAGMYIAVIEPGSYLDFANIVPFHGPKGIAETGLLNESGRLSGRAQAAVRSLSDVDFSRIVRIGLDDAELLLPRVSDDEAENPDEGMDEPTIPYDAERVRITMLTSRVVRDRIFRKVVLHAYNERCAVTGLRLINGGGRAEVAAAHIRPVEKNGPDVVTNGLALSGTAHWMFDRGLISLSDDLQILVSRQVNDREGIVGLINKGGRARPPNRLSDRPHPHFLAWHRQHCFKA
jgi:putative restriction endonuclease